MRRAILVLAVLAVVSAVGVPAAGARPGPAALSILDRLPGALGGSNTSPAIGIDGLGLISYQDHANGDLKVAHCRNVACRSAATSVLDRNGDVGDWSSLAIGADGLGLIAYEDATAGSVKVAHCLNTACSAASTTTVAPVGASPSLASGADGRGLLAFDAGGSLLVAHCSDLACTSVATTFVDSVSGGPRPSIAIGSDGLGLIAYVNRTEDARMGLDIAHCADVACSATTTTVVGGFLKRIASATIGGDGLGLIAMVDIDSNLYAVHCSDVTCATATASFGGISMLGSASIATGTDGLGLMAFVEGDAQGVGTEHCLDAACDATSFSQVDRSTTAQGLASITIGADGLPLLSLYDDGDLKVAHCSEAACAG